MADHAARDEQTEKTQGRSEEEQPRIKLIPFDEIRLDDEPEYLIDGLIPAIGITVVWGPPKSHKSFWMFDAGMHVGLGWKYRGRQVQQVTVVYCAFEGQQGAKKRCAAFRDRFLADDADPIPFYLQPLRLNLIKDAAELVQAIKDQLGDNIPGLIVLDTLNRSLVGSESRDEDMTAYLSAADMLREAFGGAVAIVHHCGVEGSRPRGHTSLTGTADAQLAVKRIGATSTVTVEFMKDGPEGDVIASRLEIVEVGLDQHGKPIISCVVIADEAPPDLGSEAKCHKLTPNQRSMLNILDDAGPAGLAIDEWNDKARENGLGKTRRMTLMDCRKALKDKGLVHSHMDRWHVTHR